MGEMQLIAWHQQQDQYMALSNISTAGSQQAGRPCPGTEAPSHETAQQIDVPSQVQNAARPMGGDCGTEAQGGRSAKDPWMKEMVSLLRTQVVQRCALQA